MALATPAAAAPDLGPPETVLDTPGPTGMDTADLNRDGRLDVVTFDLDNGQIRVALQQPDESFASTVVATADIASPGGVVVEDLDRDGRPDILGREWNNTFHPLRQAADGSFVDAPFTPSGTTPRATGVGDINGDGRPDIAFGTAFPQSLRVMLQAADGTFGAPVTIPYAPTQIEAIAFGDVDGDGTDEAVVADRGTNSVVVVGHAGGDALAVEGVVPVPGRPHDVDVADLDGDGRAEIVAGRQIDRQLSIIDFEGGSYTTRPGMPVDLNPDTVRIGDLDGDGRPDIAATAGWFTNATLLQVFTQQPDGSFVRSDHPFDKAISPWDAVIDDLDGDGDVEVLMAEYDDVDARVVVLNNRRDVTDPTATVTTPQDGATYDRGSTVAADFACADGRWGSGVDTCVGTVADGASVDTSTLGTKRFEVDVEDEAGNTATKTVSYTVVDGTDPTITVTTPTDGSTHVQGAVVAADYACADETGGSGVDTCVGTVADGAPIDTATPGTKTFAVTAEDRAGNTASRTTTYTVTPRPVDPGPGPAPTPSVPARPAPAAPPGPAGAPPAPAPPSACRTPFVTLVDLRPSGTSRRPRTTLLAVASPSLAGRRVVVRRDGRGVGAGRVGADGRISVSVPAPRTPRSRALARYRLVVGGSRSLALKATRLATITARTTLPGGRVRVAGRIAGVRIATSIVVTGTPACGDGETTVTRTRTDRRGRFSVTLAPPSGSTPAVVHRVRVGTRTVTLPVLMTATATR